MVLDSSSASPTELQVEHRHFSHFPALLQAGDVLVINQTRVVRARLIGTRAGGGPAEILLLRPSDRPRYHTAARRWHALVRPGRKLRVGAQVRFGDQASCEVIAIAPGGLREVRIDTNLALDDLLERCGAMPLPPYVGPGDECRARRYQTIFARIPGSVAAPTASLHFTDAVIAAVRDRGVIVAPLVLDVGLGTFKPIESESIDEHVMHSEAFSIPLETADAIRRAKGSHRRVIAAGTTVLRALEGAAVATGVVTAGDGETRLFVTPGFRFQVVDGLLTNFHLPASTLIVLVSAFAGYKRTMAAYEAAIAQRYRFYSFGDAMFALREHG